jgi:VWFA-related protein
VRIPPLIAVGLALVSTSPSLAQQKPQAPVFSSGTGLVLVDFVVMDRSDRLVGGLKPQDFVVKEDGKERKIVSFAAFSRGETTEAGPSEVVVAPPGVAPKTATAEGVTTVLFVDDAQLRPQEVLRLAPALKKLVDIVAEQKGILALVAPGSNIQVADTAAGNRALFWGAIDKILGQRLDDHSPYPITDAEAILGSQEPPLSKAPGTMPTGNTIVERVAARAVYLNRGLLKYDMALIMAAGRIAEVAAAARDRRAYAYEVLLKSLDFLAGKPGRRSVIMVSGGYASDKDDKRQQEVVNRSLQTNAPIHFLDARGLQGMSQFLGVEYRSAIEWDAIDQVGTFSEAAGATSGLAADTGGLYVRNTNDMVKGLSRIADMAGTYYLIGYEPPAHEKRGFRKISVEVATKGLKVLSRRGYFDEAVAPR